MRINLNDATEWFETGEGASFLGRSMYNNVVDQHRMYLSYMLGGSADIRFGYGEPYTYIEVVSSSFDPDTIRAMLDTEIEVNGLVYTFDGFSAGEDHDWGQDMRPVIEANFSLVR